MDKDLYDEFNKIHTTLADNKEAIMGKVHDVDLTARTALTKGQSTQTELDEHKEDTHDVIRELRNRDWAIITGVILTIILAIGAAVFG